MNNSGSVLYICFELVNDKYYINSDYAKYLFESSLIHKGISLVAKEGARNHGLLNIKAEDFFGVEVPIPSQKEQDEITRVLLDVDHHIFNLDNHITDLTQLKKALAKKLLTEGIGHTEFKDSEVGRIPVEWEVMGLNSVTDVRDGTHDSPKQIFKGIPLITSKNLKSGKLDFNDITYISNEDFIEISKRSNVEQGDILFAMIGTIGNPVIVNINDKIAIKNVALIKFKDSNIYNVFVKILLESTIVTDQFDRQQNGGAQKFVSLGSIRKLKIPVPNIIEQKKIANMISSVDIQIDQYQSQKNDYTQLKQGLMQQLLTGKVRVKI